MFFKILSLDGGIRGVIYGRILQETDSSPKRAFLKIAFFI